MAYCDIELNTYQALQKRVPKEDQHSMYEKPQTVLKQKQLETTSDQTSTAIGHPPLNNIAQSKLEPKRLNQIVARNKLLTAIVIGLIALNVLLIICLAAIALQSYTEKQEVTTKLIMDSCFNKVQNISANSILEQTTSHPVFQQLIVNMTASLIEDMVNNITAQLIDLRENTACDLEQVMNNSTDSIMDNITAQLMDSHMRTVYDLEEIVNKSTDRIMKNITAQLMDLHENTVYGLEEIMNNSTDSIMDNITAQLMLSHMNTVHDLEETLNKSTNSITQLLDTHVKSTTSTDQLMTQNLDTAITLIKNNYHNTVSSQLTSLTNVINTHSATSLSTKHIVENMESTLETLNTQHKILLGPASCQKIKDLYPHISSGYYTLNGKQMYCRMGELCGSDGGWTRLAYLDMNDTTVNCPSTLSYKYSSGIRACARPDSGVFGSCASVQFPSNSISYSEVCGRVMGYQYGNPEATSPGDSIDSPYLEGISITCGNPRQHVWSLIIGRTETHASWGCPCNSPSPGSTPPSFVGNDYFCESGNPSSTTSTSQILYPNDPLWDGKQCGGNEANCCSAAGLPWFHKTLSTDTTDYLELRNCGDHYANEENVYIIFYEIYVK